MASPPDHDPTAAAAKGATYLMALQISSRALTFVLNQVLLRFLTPQILGRAVQLELYSISVLFFARESLRVALQRIGQTQDEPTTITAAKGKGSNNGTSEKSDATLSSTQSNKQTSAKIQTAVNLACMPLLLGLPLTLGLGALASRTLSGAEGGQASEHTSTAVLLYGIATIIELASEPGFAAASSLLLFKVRAGAEATATVFKTLATVGSVLVAHRMNINPEVLPFAFGQLAFATALLLFYSYKLSTYTLSAHFHMFPTPVARPVEGYLLGYLSKRLLVLALSLSIQSAVKYVLTQGDSILIAALTSLQEQGTYALAANYGGLIARMLFQPIEEASRSLFAKLCSGSANIDISKDEHPPSVHQGHIRAAQILSMILRIYSLIALPAVTLGPRLAPTLLTIVAGSRWTDLGAGQVLGTYTYYIPLLAINGVTEAFVAAVANNKQLYQQSLWMGVSFAAFATSAWWLIESKGTGAEGIVWANCINMTARIGYCLWFIRSYFKERKVEFDLLAVIPSAGSIAVTATIPFVYAATTDIFDRFGIFGELAHGGSVGIILLGAVAVFEHKFLYKCFNLATGKPS